MIFEQLVKKLNGQVLPNREEISKGIAKYIAKNYSPKIIAGAFRHESESRSSLKKVFNLILNQRSESFSEKLMTLVKRKGMTAKDFYEKADIKKQNFSKIKNDSDYRPEKGTVIAFSIALELNLDETKDLLQSAGYTLSHGVKPDLIVEYFIKEKIYDIDEINYHLYERGYPRLTNRRHMGDKD